MPGEIVKKMDQFKDVNWSKIARDAIENYISDRTQSSIPQDLLERLQIEMNTEYSNGRQFAIETMAKELTFRKLANYFEEAQRRADRSAERYANENGMSIEDLKYDCDSEALEMLKDYFANIPKDASSRYCSGVYSFLKELWQTLNKQTAKS